MNLDEPISIVLFEVFPKDSPRPICRRGARLSIIMSAEDLVAERYPEYKICVSQILALDHAQQEAAIRSNDAV